MRVESNKPVAKGGWIHPLDSNLPKPVEQRQEPKVVQPEIQRLAKKCWLDGAAMRLELAAELGVSQQALDNLRVGELIQNGRRCSTWPERDARNRIIGLKRRFADGQKFYVSGSHQGINWPAGLRWIPGPLLLVEGGSDTAALLTLGLPAIGRPSNTGGVQILADVLRRTARPIIVVGERDRRIDGCKKGCRGCAFCWPGLYGAAMTAAQLRKILGPAFPLEWRIVPYGFKDSRDWLKRAAHPTAQNFLDQLQDKTVDSVSA
jgi:hypothetical protein